jgi:hypothetical protein
MCNFYQLIERNKRFIHSASQLCVINLLNNFLILQSHGGRKKHKTRRNHPGVRAYKTFFTVSEAPDK